jgi:hypothetical protein
MNGVNDAFFFVINKIIELQAFFIKESWAIARTVLLIALISAALNYAISGGGFKESMVKIAKAACFFFIIIFLYPRIIGYISAWTFEKARASVYDSMETYVNTAQTATADDVIDGAAAGEKGTYGSVVMRSEAVSEEQDPLRYFDDILANQTYGNMTYTCVAPAAVLRVVLLIAGECLRFSDEAPKQGWLPNFGAVLKGIICAFFVILTGVFAVLEYLMAFLEFMLVSSVGIILFPLSMWEGSKFMSEKFIGAIVGFFMKLLFCNIAIFLMLYGFISLSKQFVSVPFTGLPDEIIRVVFTCLLFFYICKSAPGLAQSLLTGTPSLSATGAISAAGGAVAAAGATMGMAKSALGLGAKTAFGGLGAVTQAGSAAKTVKEMGGGKAAQAAAFLGSMGHSAGETLKSAGGDLARSLLGGGKSASGGGAGSGVNRHNQLQQFLQPNEDGTKQTFGENLSKRKAAGVERGINQMWDSFTNKPDQPPEKPRQFSQPNTEGRRQKRGPENGTNQTLGEYLAERKKAGVGRDVNKPERPLEQKS